MMFGGSLLAVLPKGFFNWPESMQDGPRGCNSLSVSVNEDREGRKRPRDEVEKDGHVGGSRTPTLVSPSRRFRCGEDHPNSEDESERPLKRFRGHSKLVAVPQSVSSLPAKGAQQQQQSEFLRIIPEDVVSHCLSFLCSVEDRFALQTTCKLFRDVSNSDEMLAKVNVGGDRETGGLGIIQDHDTPATAATALAPFARAGNLEALYMLGIVKCYCYQDLKNGILMLKMASSHGFVRSSYTLGIILRDALPDEAAHFMSLAASTGCLPALQELLPAREMKERFGEPNADELRRHLDPVCLNRLLLRDYVDSAELRGLNTSHCWNPLCGKWAYKATNANSTVRMRRPWGFVFDVEGDADAGADPGRVPPLGGRNVAGLVDGAGSLDRERNSSFYPSSDLKVPGPSSPGSSGLAWVEGDVKVDRVSRMKMCSRCCRAKYCSKLCQVYDWRSSQHKMECQFL